MKMQTADIQTIKDTNQFWFGDKYSKYHLTIAIQGNEPRPEAERVLSRLIWLLNTGDTPMVNRYALEEATGEPNWTHYHLVVRDEEGTLPSFDEFQKWVNREFDLLVGGEQDDKGNPKSVLTLRQLDKSDPIEGHPYMPRYMKVRTDKKGKQECLKMEQGSFGLTEYDQVTFGWLILL